MRGVTGFDLLDGSTKFRKTALRGLQQLLAGMSQVNLAYRALKQGAVEDFLQPANLVADRALGDTELTCRQAEAQLTRCRLENLERIEWGQVMLHGKIWFSIFFIKVGKSIKFYSLWFNFIKLCEYIFDCQIHSYQHH